MWLVVHLFYVVGFKSRITTLLHWAVTFGGRARSERTATQQQVAARQALAMLGHPGPLGPGEVLRAGTPPAQAGAASPPAPAREAS